VCFEGIKHLISFAGKMSFLSFIYFTGTTHWALASKAWELIIGKSLLSSAMLIVIVNN